MPVVRRRSTVLQEESGTLSPHPEEAPDEEPATPAAHAASQVARRPAAASHEFGILDLVEVIKAPAKTPQTQWLALVLDPHLHGYIGSEPPPAGSVDLLYPGYECGARVRVNRLRSLGSGVAHLGLKSKGANFLEGLTSVAREVYKRLKRPWNLKSNASIPEVHRALCLAVGGADPRQLRLVPRKGAGVLEPVYPELRAELRRVCTVWEESRVERAKRAAEQEAARLRREQQAEKPDSPQVTNTTTSTSRKRRSVNDTQSGAKKQPPKKKRLSRATTAEEHSSAEDVKSAPGTPVKKWEPPVYEAFFPFDLCVILWGSQAKKEYYPAIVLDPQLHGTVEADPPGDGERDVHWLGFDRTISRVKITSMKTLHEGVTLLRSKYSVKAERKGIEITLKEVQHRLGEEPSVLSPELSLAEIREQLIQLLGNMQPEESETRLRISDTTEDTWEARLGVELAVHMTKVVRRLALNRAEREAPTCSTPSSEADGGQESTNTTSRSTSKGNSRKSLMEERREANASNQRLRELMAQFKQGLESGRPVPGLRLCCTCYADLSDEPTDPLSLPSTELTASCFDNPFIEGLYYCKECQTQVREAIGFAISPDPATPRLCRLCGEGDQTKILMCRSMCSSHICYGAWCKHCLNMWGGPGMYDELNREREIDADWHCPLCHPFRKTYGLFTRHANWKLNLFFLYELTPNRRSFYDPRRLVDLHKRPLKVCSFFNGCGVVFVLLRELGFQLDEANCLSFETDRKANLLSRAHNPLIPQRGDVNSLAVEELNKLAQFDLIVGGPPCQEYSLANPFGQGPCAVDKTGSLVIDFSYYYNTAVLLKQQPMGLFFENVKMKNTNRGLCEKSFHQRSVELQASDHGEVARRKRIFISNFPYFYVPYFYRTRVLDDILSEGRRANRYEVAPGEWHTVRHLRTLTSKPSSKIILGHEGRPHLPVLAADGSESHLTVAEFEDSLGYPLNYTGAKLPDGTTLSESERKAILSQGWPLTVVRQILERLKGPPTEVPGRALYSTCPLIKRRGRQRLSLLPDFGRLTVAPQPPPAPQGGRARRSLQLSLPSSSSASAESTAPRPSNVQQPATHPTPVVIPRRDPRLRGYKLPEQEVPASCGPDHVPKEEQQEPGGDEGIKFLSEDSSSPCQLVSGGGSLATGPSAPLTELESLAPAVENASAPVVEVDLQVPATEEDRSLSTPMELSTSMAELESLAAEVEPDPQQTHPATEEESGPSTPMEHDGDLTSPVVQLESQSPAVESILAATPLSAAELWQIENNGDVEIISVSPDSEILGTSSPEPCHVTLSNSSKLFRDDSGDLEFVSSDSELAVPIASSPASSELCQEILITDMQVSHEEICV